MTPVWFMRQAGRYMADYRALRERYSLLEICRAAGAGRRGHAAAGRRHRGRRGDPLLRSAAALHAARSRLRFREGRGAGHRSIRSGPPPTSSGCASFEPRDELGHVLETIRLLRRELDGRVPLIGFGGAPFTLAAYAIEGGPSTNYTRTKAFMYAQPRAWHRLCERLGVDDGRLHARADRSRCAGDSDLRLVGRRPERRRLPRVRAAAHAARSSTGWPAPACRSSTSASGRRQSCATWPRRAAT